MNICCLDKTNTSSLQEKGHKILNRVSSERKIKKPTTFYRAYFVLHPTECQLPWTFCHSVVSWRGLPVSESIMQIEISGALLIYISRGYIYPGILKCNDTLCYWVCWSAVLLKTLYVDGKVCKLEVSDTIDLNCIETTLETFWHKIPVT